MRVEAEKKRAVLTFVDNLVDHNLLLLVAKGGIHCTKEKSLSAAEQKPPVNKTSHYQYRPWLVALSAVMLVE